MKNKNNFISDFLYMYINIYFIFKYILLLFLLILIIYSYFSNNYLENLKINFDNIFSVIELLNNNAKKYSYIKYIKSCKSLKNFNNIIYKKYNEYPFLSICILVFNSEIYIERALLSIINQSIQDFEIIIINDFSNDNTY